MNDYYENNGSPGGTALVSTPAFGLAIAPIAPSQINTREHRQLARRADLAAASDRYQAHLAQAAIVHTATLCVIADQAIRAVPSCEQSIRGIVDAYAKCAAERIARW